MQVRAHSECEQCYSAKKRLLRRSVEGFVAVFDVRPLASAVLCPRSRTVPRRSAVRGGACEYSQLCTQRTRPLTALAGL
jgi:hypothetical protein